jgi:alpha-galactosidase
MMKPGNKELEMRTDALPPMGWNSWNSFGSFVTEGDIRATAENLVRLGFRDAGYRYVVLDDHWHGGRGEDGRLFANRERFPSGIAALAEYVHSLGLLFGIYSDAAERTCGGEPGQLRL